MRRMRSGLVQANATAPITPEHGGKDEQPELDPREEERAERRERDDHRRAHVATGHDGGEDQDRHRDERDQHVGPRPQQRPLAEEDEADPQGERQLEELRRLRLEAGDHDPVPVAVRFDADAGHEHEQLHHDRQDQRRPRDLPPERDREAAHDEHQRDAEQREHPLLEDVLIGGITRRRRRRRRRRQDHDEPESGQQQRRRGDEQELPRDGREDPAEIDPRRETALRGRVVGRDRLRRKLPRSGRRRRRARHRPPSRTCPSLRPRTSGLGRRRTRTDRRMRRRGRAERRPRHARPRRPVRRPVP